MFRKIALVVSVSTMTALPVVAQAAPAPTVQSLSTSQGLRTGTSGTDKSGITRQGTIIGGILVLGIIAGAIIALSNDDDNDTPASR